MPDGTKPLVPIGFEVEMVADGFQQPRVIRTAPNGDLFVADSKANQVHVLRMENGSATPIENSVFASGLNQPYGIAFYPLGDNPEWVYIANADGVVRFPYKSGDLKASGDPETIVEGISHRPPLDSRHSLFAGWQPDVSRGWLWFEHRRAGLGEPNGGIEAFAADHALGAMWGAESGPGQRARLQSRWVRRADLRNRPPELLRNDDPAGERRPLVRGQRA